MIALFRRTLLPWTASVESFACAPSARQLLVDVVRHAGLKRATPPFIGRDQTRDSSFDECGFVRVEENICGSRENIWTGIMATKDRSCSAWIFIGPRDP